MQDTSFADKSLAVLLFENSSPDAERIATFLVRDGWSCALTRVAERREFEAALVAGKFDLVLAEYALPDCDGLATLALLDAHPAEVPLIFVTSVRGEEVAIEALKQGAADYVLKSRLERLSPAIRRALREADERTTCRQAQAALRETSRRKDEFLGLLGHELRNPLAALSNATALWRRKAHDPALQQWCQEVIERQVQNLMRLVDEMVDISRVIRGVIRLSRQPLELGPLVLRVAEGMRTQADGRGLRLGVMNEAPGVQVDADAPRLERVLGSLLRNAIQFTAEAGHVDVTIRRQGSAVEVLVQDDGIGMTTEVLPRVFDLFAQVDQTLERTHGGLGVSLTVAHRLVELHGGTLTAASPGTGAGSTFTLRLDILPKPEERAGAGFSKEQ